MTDPLIPPIVYVEVMEDEGASEQPGPSQAQLSEMNPTKPTVHPDTLRSACALLLNMYIEEYYHKTGKDVGMLLAWGPLEALGVTDSPPDEYEIVDMPGMDIFGNPVGKKDNTVIQCPKCPRKVGAPRFAAHLENCMGLGRTSSRASSKQVVAAFSNVKIDNKPKTTKNSNNDTKGKAQKAVAGGQNQKKPLTGEPGSKDDHSEEEEDDEDWSLDKKRKKSKKSKEKVAVKREGPVSKVSCADGIKKRRGRPPKVKDSPASFDAAVENSIHEP